MRGNFICTLNCDFAVFVLGVAAVLLVVSGAYGRDGLTVFQHEKSAQQALPNGRSNDESQSVKRSDDVMALEQVVQQQANMMQTMQARLTALQSDVIDLRSKLQTSSKAGKFDINLVHV
ncbi:hypothetical protein BaRGS_00004479 [Batillaria attramentaria]|uniref:Uncharacterized protein n=1 Tax=Batillaria attramentaria TaxID=370345 RepID=A0ABD0LXB4_9CAEN